MIPRDGVLLVHSAFKRLSKAGYNPSDFTADLVDYMAPGTLLMPAMSWRSVNPDNPIFDELETPGITGILSETFRKKFASHRSLHPTHSVSGCGRLAESLLQSHHLDDTPCSKNSPFGLLSDHNAYVLLVGVGFERCTLIHHVEELMAPDLYLRPFRDREEYVCRDRQGNEINVFVRRHYKLVRDFYQFEAPLIENGNMKFRLLGEVSFKFFAAKDLVELVSETLRNFPGAILASPPPQEF